jgi:hypothetical protein
MLSCAEQIVARVWWSPLVLFSSRSARRPWTWQPRDTALERKAHRLRAAVLNVTLYAGCQTLAQRRVGIDIINQGEALLRRARRRPSTACCLSLKSQRKHFPVIAGSAKRRPSLPCAGRLSHPYDADTHLYDNKTSFYHAPTFDIANPLWVSRRV